MFFIHFTAVIIASPFQNNDDLDMQNSNFSHSFYDCETCSLILREEHKSKVLQNTVPRKKKYSPKNNDVSEQFTILHNEELGNLVK
jgi:hypothetical protein